MIGWKLFTGGWKLSIRGWKLHSLMETVPCQGDKVYHLDGNCPKLDGNCGDVG